LRLVDENVRVPDALANLLDAFFLGLRLFVVFSSSFIRSSFDE
jgi:hypothetical protein